MALGSPKLTYLYVDDSGKNWTVKLASDDVISSSGLTVYNAASPPTGGVQGKLSAKRCRRVYGQGFVAPATGTQNRIIRRAFVCNISGTLYASNSPQNVSYTGVVGGNITTTGRRGEKLSF